MSDVNVPPEGLITVEASDLQCGICFDICYPVYETDCCGYLFCEIHKNDLTKCPICRENNTSGRNGGRGGLARCQSSAQTSDFCHPAPLLNRLVANLATKCKYCEEKCVVSEMGAHQVKCPQRVHTCNICKQLGIERYFNRAELMMHFTVDHEDEFMKMHDRFETTSSSERGRAVGGPVRHVPGPVRHVTRPVPQVQQGDVTGPHRWSFEAHQGEENRNPALTVTDMLQ